MGRAERRQRRERGPEIRHLVAVPFGYDLEDAMHNAVLLSDESGTMACIAETVAEAHCGGVPGEIEESVREMLGVPAVGGGRGVQDAVDLTP